MWQGLLSRILLGAVEGWREAFSNRFRSFIAILAIVIGTGSLLATFSLVEGSQAGERKFFELFGGMKNVRIDGRPTPREQQSRKDLSPGRTMRDIDAILRSAPLVARAGPYHNVEPRASVSDGKNVFSQYDVRGCTPDFLQLLNYQIASGRYLCDLDMANHRRVAVIGPSVADALKLWPDPVGKRILISESPFRVVGVLTRTDTEMKNRHVQIPITTAQRMFWKKGADGAEDLNLNLQVNLLMIDLRDTKWMDATLEQVTNVLKITHRGIDDYAFDTKEDWAEALYSRIAASRLTGGLTALVSLFVGGVGIANVMLTSVRQRMREIGVRRAVGARSIDIFVQILGESLLLGIVGGLLGIAVGHGLLALMATWMEPDALPVLTLRPHLISFAAAMVVGVLAGLLPAIKGAQISPNEALRYE